MRPCEQCEQTSETSEASELSIYNGKGSPYLISERRVPELIPVLPS